MDTQSRKEQVARLAARQQGRVTRAQLNRLGVTKDAMRRWVESGEVIRVLPRVYAIGHTAPGREGDLWAAVLYAGPGAMLSHATAAHWMGLIDYAPRVIEVSTPREVRSIPGVRVYARRGGLERAIQDGIPVTPIPMMMLDLAATNNLKVVNRALSQLDHNHRLDVAALERACGPGYAGSTALHEALANYQPKLKYANGPLEKAFLELCERRRLPLPLLNVRVHGILSDAYWPDAGLVIELDSEDNHSSKAQRRRDRRNDLELRGHGLVVLRYDWVLVHEQAEAVKRDVMMALEQRLATDMAAARRRRRSPRPAADRTAAARSARPR